MKAGLTLEEMGKELRRQELTKRDFISDTRKLVMVGASHVQLHRDSTIEEFKVSEYAHSQIASDLSIPKPFYDRLRREHPELLEHNVSTLWQREPKMKMVRTLDGELRGYQSNKYRRLDNYDLCNLALGPALKDYPDIKIASSGLTPTKMFIKATLPSMRGEVKVGEIVEAGFSISNSEVGDGSVVVDPLLMKLACLNGMIVPMYSQRKKHVGKRIGETDEAYELYADETKKADDMAFWMKVRDTIRGVLTRDIFEKLLQKSREAAGVSIEDTVDEAIELATTTLSLSERQSEGVLRHLLRDGDYTVWGLANAVTRQSQDENDYGEATRLEREGGRLIELPSSDWTRLAA